MKKINLMLAALAMLVAALFVGCLKDKENLADDLADTVAQQQNANGYSQNTEEAHIIKYSSNVIPGQYIVVYKNDALPSGRSLQGKSYREVQDIMREEATSTMKKNTLKTDKVSRVYGHALKGFALIGADEQDIEALRRDPSIDYIEQDQTIHVNMGGPPGGGGGGEATPWGISYVGGAGNGIGKRAWIIDSGIDLDHPDLNVDVDNAVNYAGGSGNGDDGNGHGTHVAGTVAAIDNEIGVIGVAAGAWVVPVRVLGNNGSGSIQNVIAGVDYVKANANTKGSLGDVANMSLGGGVSTSLNNAVISASATCPFTIAAGNEAQHANNTSPSSASQTSNDDIIVVASMTQSETWSSFSNYGKPPVDYIAPGSSILSTYKGGGYATLSGTSMAAPHVCGILLLGNITSGGTVTHAGVSYTIAHR